MFFRHKRKEAIEPFPVPLEVIEQLPVPAVLLPVEGVDEFDDDAPGRRPRTWLWTLAAALAVVLVIVYLILLGGKAVYDGLKDRSVANRQIARDHLALGRKHLEAQEYELAIAELALALRYDATLSEAQARLKEAERGAQAQATPTSETRRDAVALLYKQTLSTYQAGNLAQAVAALEELHSLDGDYQRQNVEAMLTSAHYQLGLDAVRQDHLDEAAGHFEAVLALKPDDPNARDQLNLMDLYKAALSYWEQDWPATIQALKGLYALAPEYKDVRNRLHDAYSFRAAELGEDGNWCAASEEYGAAVSILSLEETVDRRDDAAIRCQATAQAPRPTSSVVSSPPPNGTASPQATGSAVSHTGAVGQGQIAFASFDALQQRYDLYIVDLAQGSARLVQENASQPDFGPGGRRLAFRNRHPSHLGVSVLTLGTNELIEVTGHAEDASPAWSPDTNHLVFASNKHGDRKWRLYAISPGEVKGEGQEWGYGEMPDWSPDNKRVAYHSCDERGDRCGVWVMKAGGSDPVYITRHSSDTAPTWSPDGKRIAYISSRNGNWELYAVDVASGQEVRLTDHEAADVAPTWSPDGGRLAFLSNRDGAWALYVLDLRSGRAQKVIATGDAYPDPVVERISWGP